MNSLLTKGDFVNCMAPVAIIVEHVERTEDVWGQQTDPRREVMALYAVASKFSIIRDDLGVVSARIILS